MVVVNHLRVQQHGVGGRKPPLVDHLAQFDQRSRLQRRRLESRCSGIRGRSVRRRRAGLDAINDQRGIAEAGFADCRVCVGSNDLETCEQPPTFGRWQRHQLSGDVALGLQPFDRLVDPRGRVHLLDEQLTVDTIQPEFAEAHPEDDRDHQQRRRDQRRQSQPERHTFDSR